MDIYVESEAYEEPVVEKESVVQEKQVLYLFWFPILFNSIFVFMILIFFY